MSMHKADLPVHLLETLIIANSPASLIQADRVIGEVSICMCVFGVG